MPGSFTNPAVERRFLDDQNRRMAKQDAQIYTTLACLWMGSSLWSVLRERAITRVFRAGLAGAAAWLLPWLLYYRTPHVYVRHRRFWVSAFRLGCVVLLPTVTGWLPLLPPEQQLSTSPGSMASTLVRGAQLPQAWVLALGLRLDLRRQLLLGTAAAALVVLGKAQAFCQTPFISNPATLHSFWALARRFTRWAGLMVMSPPSPDPAPEPGGPLLHHCYAVMATVHIVFGFLVPTAMVYIMERRSRAEWVERAAAESGEGLAEAAQQLGLSMTEGLSVCCFDPLAAWIRFLCLLLPAAAATWLVVLTLVEKWVAVAPVHACTA